MIHPTASPAINMTSDRLKAAARSVELDDGRIEKIFAEAKLKISKEQIEIHKIAELWLSAEEAVAANLVTEIKEFGPPKGTQLFFIGTVA